MTVKAEFFSHLFIMCLTAFHVVIQIITAILQLRTKAIFSGLIITALTEKAGISVFLKNIQIFQIM